MGFSLRSKHGYSYRLRALNRPALKVTAWDCLLYDVLSKSWVGRLELKVKVYREKAVLFSLHFLCRQTERRLTVRAADPA